MNNLLPSYELSSDHELVAASLHDELAFGVLIDRYEAKLTRYLRRMSNFPKEDLEDILQNVFIKVYTNLNDVDTDLSFNSWIYRITHNEAIDWFRRSRNRTNQSGGDYPDELFENLPGNDELLDELIRVDDRREVALVVQGMELKYREVLILRFFEGKSYEEIGDILKKPVSTVGTLVRRAKQSFKEHYEQRYGTQHTE